MDPSPPAGSRHRRARLALRAPRPTSVLLVALTLLFGGTTIADAANGGNFLLGKSNTETATATLSNTKGIPLSLSGPAAKPPLAVNSQTMVKNLNAQFTGGLTASQLEVRGAAAATPSSDDIPIDNNGEVVISTGTLPVGLYWVTTTALLFVQAGDSLGECFLITSSDPNPLTESGAPDSGEGDVNAAATTAVLLSAPAALEEFCVTFGFNGSFARNAAITAIRIGSQLTKTKPATGVPLSALLPRRVMRAVHLPRR